MMNKKEKRRSFLRKSLFAASGIIGAPMIVPAHTISGTTGISPSDKINLASIGVGGMGTGHVRSFLGYPDVQYRAVCDVRKEHRDRAKGYIDEQYGNNDCDTYNDFRELLSRKDIDAVVIATPEHWHALIGLEACRQGKDMYYEKPLSLFFEECLAMRRAVNRSGVVFQHGTQQRSDKNFRHTCELVRNGYLGEVDRIIIGSASYEPVGVQEEMPIPEGLDYNMWLGPAPVKPYTDLRCTRQFTLINDYSLGCLSGAWGIHHVDIAQWSMNADAAGPLEVEGIFFNKPENGLFDTYHTWEVHHKYPNGTTLMHMDHFTARKKEPLYIHNNMGMLFVGSEGWIAVKRGFIDAHPKSLLTKVIGPNEDKLYESNDHRRNFLDCVKSREETICPIEVAVRSDTVCHQADIAFRTGKKLNWDPTTEKFSDESTTANRLLSRPMRAPWSLN